MDYIKSIGGGREEETIKNILEEDEMDEKMNDSKWYEKAFKEGEITKKQAEKLTNGLRRFSARVKVPFVWRRWNSFMAIGILKTPRDHHNHKKVNDVWILMMGSSKDFRRIVVTMDVTCTVEEADYMALCIDTGLTIFEGGR